LNGSWPRSPNVKKRQTHYTRLCTLAAEEFIRRFLQHILPEGRVKVRYHGFFSPGQRRRLDQLRQQLGGLQAPECLPPIEPPETLDPAAAVGPPTSAASSTLSYLW
jgi:hypothetical protein